mgnify:CR=1 FL=1
MHVYVTAKTKYGQVRLRITVKQWQAANTAKVPRAKARDHISIKVKERLNKAGAEMHIVKNSIFRIAAKEVGVADLGATLAGQIAVITGRSTSTTAFRAGDMPSPISLVMLSAALRVPFPR